ncbi:hypothetical protein [Flammeovirga aprica]|uniref:Uncharacterized protein n=1 Tax=Flammeovirga aprica JL-4 TaxID=694437 RepID=A0A7X9XA10_9BACT|nr:hypothetical protein [Flammeovirga aprica]NME69194.1 hypothetical protein [Flammeovirga aprica JL-4]
MKSNVYFKLLHKGLNKLASALRTDNNLSNSNPANSRNLKAVSYKGLFHETNESIFVQNYIFYPDNTFKVEKYEMRFENDVPVNYEIVVDNGRYVKQEGIYTNMIVETGFSNYIREGNTYKNLKKGVLKNKITESIDFTKEALSGIPWVNEYIDPIVFENKIKTIAS